MMQANYHTHTVRCNHAEGSDRDFVESALNAGIKVLGFSDHTPQVFRNGHVSGFRMLPDELGGYVDSLLALREEYRGRVDVRIGLEAEYYPAHFDDLIALTGRYDMDYLILGQHFMNNEYDGGPCGAPHEDEAALTAFENQILAALNTGKFAYWAHPDMFNFTGDDAVYRKHMKRLCEEAKSLGIPLEINFLGWSDHRHYPCDKFLRVAAEVGNEMIFGCDAHNPGMLADEVTFADCTGLLEKYGLKRIETIRYTLKAL